MYEVTDETYSRAYKPLDIVSDKHGNVGMIRETNVNTCQTSFESQISYAICWLTGDITKVAWFKHSELTQHCNIMIKLAECATGQYAQALHVTKLFKHM